MMHRNGLEARHVNEQPLVPQLRVKAHPEYVHGHIEIPSQ